MKKLSILLICLLFSCEKTKETVEFTFGRDGVFLSSVNHGQIDVYQNGSEVKFKKERVGSKTGLHFEWIKNTVYNINIDDTSYIVESPQKPTPVNITTIELDDISSFVKEGRSIDTEVAISPSNKYVGIASYTGSFKLYDIVNGNVKWSYNVNEGIVKKIIFSDDSKYVFVGEQSMDGKVLCFDVETGNELWSYTLANDLERSSAPRSDDPYGLYTLPGAFHFEFIEGDLFVAGVHSWYEGMQAKKRSKLYRFDVSGKKVWEFPKKKPLETSILFFSSTKNYTVFNVGDVLGKNESKIKDESIVLIDSKTGTLLDQKNIPPLPPYFPKVAFWQSVSIDKDDLFANMGAYDGRGFILPIKDNTFSSLISLELGKPVEVSGIPITAGIPYTNSFNNHAVYSVVQTTVPYSFSSENNVNEPPALHPAAGTLFFYDQKGKLVWRFHNGLIYSSVHHSKNGEWFIATLDNKKENRERNQFGFSLFNYSNNSYSKVFDYQTNGYAFFKGTMSSTGKFMAISEIPFIGSDGETIRGRYQIHLVH